MYHRKALEERVTALITDTFQASIGPRAITADEVDGLVHAIMKLLEDERMREAAADECEGRYIPRIPPC